MEQYVEYIFIENFIINISILLLIKNISKKQTKNINLIISSIIVSIYSCIAEVYQEILNIFIIKILMAFLFIYVAFIPKKIKTYMILNMYYLLIYFVFIGVVISLTIIFKFNISLILIKWLVYSVSILITYMVSEIMWKVWKRSIKKDNLTLNIVICDYNIKAFIDSGNTVKGIDNLPVIFIKNKYKEILSEMLRKCEEDILKVNTLNGSKIYQIFLVKNIKLRKEGKEILLKKVNVAFTDMLNINCCDALISYDIYLNFLERNDNNE